MAVAQHQAKYHSNHPDSSKLQADKSPDQLNPPPEMAVGGDNKSPKKKAKKDKEAKKDSDKDR